MTVSGLVENTFKLANFNFLFFVVVVENTSPIYYNIGIKKYLMRAK